MIEGTAMVWFETITDRRVWNRADDMPRFRHAFRGLQGSCTQWPQPANFLEHMPQAQDHQPKLTRMIDEGAKRRMQSLMDEFASHMGYDFKPSQIGKYSRAKKSQINGDQA